MRGGGGIERLPEDVMTGQLPGFFLSCTVFLGVFLLAADAVLTKRDVVA